MKRLEKILEANGEEKRARDVVVFLKALSGHNMQSSDKKILTDAAEIVQYFIDKTF